MKHTLYSFFIALTFLTSCSTPYAVTKSNRDSYSINDKIGVDSAIIKTYLPYKIALDSEMNKVIGYAEVALVKKSGLPESTLGNFFSDAVFNQAKKIQPNIDFALPSTTGGLRNDVAMGPIKVSTIFELMPFENEAVVFTLKGKDVFEILKFIAASGGQPVSGLKMNIKNNLPDQVIINGKEFDSNKDYFILTSDYISSGGDNTIGFANPISKKVLGLKIREALLNEVSDIQAQGKKINAKLDGRITKN